MAHTGSASQLQTPKWAMVNGDLVPYGDVRIHISAEALTRALSVFEGVKGYWNIENDTFSLRTPQRHYDRLRKSASIFHIPVDFSFDDYVAWMGRIADELVLGDRDLWFRTTLYVTQGHWGEGTKADLVTTAFTQQTRDTDPMKLGVSTWRRPADVALPTRVKSSANYVIARLARIEANRLGYDDAILLNAEGRVAEATGACVVISDGARVITPPPTEGCLESITVAVIERVCEDLGVPFERRPIDRTELLTAAECGVAGTISELTLVDEIDGYHFATDGVLRRVREAYIALMRGKPQLPGIDMVPIGRWAGASA